MTEKYTIGEFEFDTYKEYKKGLADVQMIYYITHNVDIYNPQTALRLYNMIKEEKIELHSVIGECFYNDLVDIVMNHTGSLLKWKTEMPVPEEEKRTTNVNVDKPKKILGIICLIAACVCFVFYFWTEYTNQKGERIADDLRQMKQEGAAGLVSNNGFVPPKQDTTEQGTETDGATEETSVLTMLPEYQAIYNENPDLVGWLTIDGTNIDYPVMQTVSDPTFYLRRNFNKEEDNNGTLFIDYRDSITQRSTNLIIYGHNMKSKMMFGQLKSYQDASFFQEHKNIKFDTIYEKGTYQVFAVCLAEVEYQDENAFRYYNFTQADSQEEFDNFIQNIRQLAVQYEDGVVSFGDELLTLSTCNNYTEDGRLFVVAKKCKDAE